MARAILQCILGICVLLHFYCCSLDTHQWTLNMTIHCFNEYLASVFSSVAYRNTTDVRYKTFIGYDKYLRPLCKGYETVNVTVDNGVRQILKLDEPTQVLTIKFWMRLTWKDCRLTWNATETGVNHLIVPKTVIWIPDLVLYESTEGDMFTEMGDYRLKINSEGEVSFLWPIILKSFCKLKVTYFPFDTQMCDFTFGSWRYDGTEVNFFNVTHKGDMNLFKKSVEWQITSYDVSRQVTHYKCCPQPFPTILFRLGVRRRPLFYIVCLILPCILVTGLTTLGFMLPVESGEKVSLQITVLLALLVFLLVIQESLPPSSDHIPLLGLYFASTMALVTFSCVTTVVVIHIHFKTKKRVPNWSKKYILGKLASLLCIGGSSLKQPDEPREENSRKDLFSDSHDINQNSKYMSESHTIRGRGHSAVDKRISVSVDSPSVLGAAPVSRNVVKEEKKNNTTSQQKMAKATHKKNLTQTSREVSPARGETTSTPIGTLPNVNQFIHIKCQDCEDQVQILKNIERNYVEDAIEAERREEWHRLAIVIDRLCFYIVLISVVVSSGGIFFQFTSL